MLQHGTTRPLWPLVAHLESEKWPSVHHRQGPPLCSCVLSDCSTSWNHHRKSRSTPALSGKDLVLHAVQTKSSTFTNASVAIARVQPTVVGFAVARAETHFLQMLVAVAVSISQAALGWYGDCDGSRHLPREAAADHARESLSLLGMSQLCHANPWNANCSPFSQQKLWNASHLPKGRAATNKSIEIAAWMADHHLLLNTSCAKM